MVVIFWTIVALFFLIIMEGFILKPIWHFDLYKKIYPNTFGKYANYLDFHMSFGYFKVDVSKSIKLGFPVFLDDTLDIEDLKMKRIKNRLIYQRLRIILYVVLIMVLVVLLLIFN